jgi:hypothetical protein
MSVKSRSTRSMVCSKEQGLCPDCGKNKPLEGQIRCVKCCEKIRKRARGTPGQCHYNRTCPNPPEPNKKYCKKHLQKLLDNQKNKRKTAKIKGFCSICGKSNKNKLATCDKCRARQKESRDKRNKTMRDQVFNHYGGYKCVCCGETTQMLLTLDHKNNDGAEHRRQLGGSRTLKLYRWIIDNNYPPMFQILCWNCNIGKYLNGGVCPHKTKTESVVDLLNPSDH